MTNNHVRVASAWKRGEFADGGSLHTDGETITSYGHVIGTTTPEGRKVGFECGYSVTTARHSRAVAAVADVARRCPEREHWSRRMWREWNGED